MSTLIAPPPAASAPFSAFDTLLVTAADSTAVVTTTLPVSVGALVILMASAALVALPLFFDVRWTSAPPRPLP